MKRFATVILAAGLIGGAMAMPASAAKPESSNKQVWVCHFPGHEAAEAWTGGGTTLDGDYVVAYADGMPLQNQVDYCETRGGHLIEISSRALKGHGAQLTDRVADYPER